tara:strand:- start:298 stop:1056 length:759 start_codon:yes stop_codon:yes gene_type:complete
MRQHISFSELKIWNECAFKHKLTYIDGIRGFKGNEHTAFGTAMHYVCENVFDQKTNLSTMFQQKFLEELTLLKKDKVDLNKKLVSEMRVQGEKMLSYILPAVKETFESFEVFSVEEDLYLPIQNNKKFKGYIDLVLKIDNTYHIIDWKTCSWGWDMKRRTDRMTTYQLTLYKHFFAKKHNIEPSKIETHFALLKRTAKKDNVEIFRVTSGSKKTENALKLLNKALYNMDKNVFVKNRLSCRRCEFYKTEHCQ